MDYFIEAWKKCAVFSGRARRREYWYFQLFNFLAAIVLGFANGFVDAIAGKDAAAIFALPGALFVLASIVPSLSVTIRRLHDTNRSGWYLLLPIIPFIGGLIVLIMLCEDGTQGPNRFGEDPKSSTLITVPQA